jgi:hypothetical protein
MLKINLPEILRCYQIGREWQPEPDTRFPIEIVIDGKRTSVVDHQVIHKTKNGSFVSIAVEKSGEAHVLITSDSDATEKLRFYTRVKPTSATLLFAFDRIWIDEDRNDGSVACGVMSPPRVPFRRVFWERKFYSKADRYHFGLDADQMVEAMKGPGRTVVVKNNDGILVVAKFSGTNLLSCSIKKGYSNVKLAKETIRGYNKLQLNPASNQEIVMVE